jgi:hypothetical protein
MKDKQEEDYARENRIMARIAVLCVWGIVIMMVIGIVLAVMIKK